ncbi:MAG: hypothetical protein ACREV4_14510, partial [Gammaproteobacteria bacterium]
LALCSMAVVGLEPGYFRALHRPEALWFGGCWRLGWAQAKGDGSARGDEPGRDSDQAIWNRSKLHIGAAFALNSSCVRG